MPAEETKHDLLLKRIQITIAILVGLTGLILGIYNIKKNILSKEEPPKPTIVIQQPPAPSNSPSRVREALDEAGASWIKKIASTKSSSDSGDSK